MLDFGFYNEDCLPRMKEYPDNFFDLAVVDPPYGDAGGGTDCRPSSQFTTEDGAGTPQKSRGGVEQVRSTLRQVQEPATTPSDFGRRTRITRTGGTWAEKYAKKSLRGMSRRGRNILTNCSASHGIR